LGLPCKREMPLSAERKIALKNPNTTIKYQGDNPKTPGSKANQRFEKYKASQTIGEATAAGANWQDLAGDFEKGLFTITPTIEEFRGTGSKRGAEESTPDREASARAKVAKDVTPCSLESVALAASSSAKVETSKVEMSAATIAALRTMMREELSNTLEDYCKCGRYHGGVATRTQKGKRGTRKIGTKDSET